MSIIPIPKYGLARPKVRKINRFTNACTSEFTNSI